ncbi:hypothetical protein ATANTOWER_021460 [Ataeniobius toweri]|uniref:Uncharacterized protein n=1 Tax=Ataeniobius toweri TaxID=208326 RepID=A0ABU7BQX0_9TELE|nr:hypothetical protein [Ataeniobius toweri]
MSAPTTGHHKSSLTHSDYYLPAIQQTSTICKQSFPWTDLTGLELLPPSLDVLKTTWMFPSWISLELLPGVPDKNTPLKLVLSTECFLHVGQELAKNYDKESKHKGIN